MPACSCRWRIPAWRLQTRQECLGPSDIKGHERLIDDGWLAGTNRVRLVPGPRRVNEGIAMVRGRIHSPRKTESQYYSRRMKKSQQEEVFWHGAFENSRSCDSQPSGVACCPSAALIFARRDVSVADADKSANSMPSALCETTCRIYRTPDQVVSRFARTATIRW